MSDMIEKLYETAMERKKTPLEGSYTCYLYEKGLDKILKKIGEESAEVMIAAKNGVKADTVGELCDLIYHMTILMANEGIAPDDLRAELERRAGKSGNLKPQKTVDRNT